MALEAILTLYRPPYGGIGADAQMTKNDCSWCGDELDRGTPLTIESDYYVARFCNYECLREYASTDELEVNFG